MDQILQRIKAARHILVASHKDPDGDALGSLLAMGLACIQLGKRATLYNESPIPAVYQFLPCVGLIQRRMEPPEAYDAAVILDCGDLSRVGERWPDVGRVPVIINIDHHISNTGFGQLRLIDGQACATAEIVFRLIRALDAPLDREIATCIYTGILTDTGSFRFANTNSAAFAISREMTELGVDPCEVAQHVFGSYSLGRIKLLNLALNSIEISPNGRLSLMTVTHRMLEETHTQQEDVDGLINYARRIEAVRVAALVQEQTNGSAALDGRSWFHVSLRSDGTVNVADLAGAFGGGGHHSAAGFQIESTLAAVRSSLLDWSERMA